MPTKSASADGLAVAVPFPIPMKSNKNQKRVNDGIPSVTGRISSTKVITEVYFPLFSPNILKLTDAAMGAHTMSITGKPVETVPTASRAMHCKSFLYLPFIFCFTDAN